MHSHMPSIAKRVQAIRCIVASSSQHGFTGCQALVDECVIGRLCMSSVMFGLRRHRTFPRLSSSTGSAVDCRSSSLNVTLFARLLRYVAPLAFRNGGRANSWRAGRCLPTSGRLRPNSPKFGRLPPKSAKLARSRPNLGRRRPILGRNRPILDDIAWDSTTFGQNSANIGLKSSNLGA